MHTPMQHRTVHLQTFGYAAVNMVSSDTENKVLCNIFYTA